MVKEAIVRVVQGDNLTEKEMEATMGEVVTGKATAAQIAVEPLVFLLLCPFDVRVLKSVQGVHIRVTTLIPDQRLAGSTSTLPSTV